jgi:hypothetical protein
MTNLFLRGRADQRAYATAARNRLSRERMVARDAGSSPLGVKVRMRLARIARAPLNPKQSSALLDMARSLLPGKRARARRYPGTSITKARPKIVPKA